MDSPTKKNASNAGGSNKEKEFEGTGRLYAPEKQLKDAASVKPVNESLGQGLLYAPPNAVENQDREALQGGDSKEQSRDADDTKQEGGGTGIVVIETSKEVAADVRAALVLMKDTVMEKLTALPLPAEALEAGRKSMENLVKEMSHTYDNAKEAVQRTKHRIAGSISSMSPNPAKDAKQVAEDVERNVLKNAEGNVPETHHSKAYHDLNVSTGNTNSSPEGAKHKVSGSAGSSSINSRL